MKKSNFAALILGTIGMVFFAQTRQGSQLPAISVRCLSNTWGVHLLNIKKNTSHPNVFPRIIFCSHLMELSGIGTV